MIRWRIVINILPLSSPVPRPVSFYWIQLPSWIWFSGNKCDLEDKRQVSKEEGENLAKERGFPFFETSGKTGQHIDLAFFGNKFDFNKASILTRSPTSSCKGDCAVEISRCNKSKSATSDRIEGTMPYLLILGLWCLIKQTIYFSFRCFLARPLIREC